MYLPVCHYKIVTNNDHINNGTTSGLTDAVIKKQLYYNKTTNFQIFDGKKL